MHYHPVNDMFRPSVWMTTPLSPSSTGLVGVYGGFTFTLLLPLFAAFFHTSKNTQQNPFRHPRLSSALSMGLTAA